MRGVSSRYAVTYFLEILGTITYALVVFVRYDFTIKDGVINLFILIVGVVPIVFSIHELMEREIAKKILGEILTDFDDEERILLNIAVRERFVASRWRGDQAAREYLFEGTRRVSIRLMDKLHEQDRVGRFAIDALFQRSVVGRIRYFESALKRAGVA